LEKHKIKLLSGYYKKRYKGDRTQIKKRKLQKCRIICRTHYRIKGTGKQGGQ
jgi:hypothetical protein